MQLGHKFKGDWVLYRCSIAPALPEAATRVLTRVAAVAFSVLLRDLEVGAQVWDLDLTRPIRINCSEHAWVAH